MMRGPRTKVSTIQIVFLVFWVTVCSYAAIRGGAPERVAAVAQASAVVATMIVSVLWRPSAGSYASVEVAVALTDLTLFGVILALALTSTRFWPMLQASMMGCGLLGHIVKPLAPDVLPRAYYAIVAIWGYPTILLLAVATWRHRVRLKRYGVDYAWVWNLPRRYRHGWSVDELARPLPQR